MAALGILSRQGWLVLGGSVVVLVAARLLGLGELYVFGACGLGLVAFAALYVGIKRVEIEVDRTVHPQRVHAGQASRVDLRIRNLRPANTPVLRLHDPVSGTAGAELVVSPLAHDAAAVATYRLPTDRRGLLRVGPLTVTLGDPFGLTQTKLIAAPQTQATIYPTVDTLHPSPVTSRRDPMASTPLAHALGRGGEDFYALRPYVVGDDLRRVHWPSTARHDELLVRQHDEPRHGRSTVLLDIGLGRYDPASFEVAVSAAASIVTANGARDREVRLATTDGVISDHGTGHHHLETLLERLALVQPTPVANLRRSIDGLASDRGPYADGHGALVVVLAQATRNELTALGRMRTRFESVTIVEAGDGLNGDGRRPEGGGNGATGDHVTNGATADASGAVIVRAGGDLVSAWNRAVAAQANDGRRTA